MVKVFVFREKPKKKQRIFEFRCLLLDAALPIWLTHHIKIGARALLRVLKKTLSHFLLNE